VGHNSRLLSCGEAGLVKCSFDLRFQEIIEATHIYDFLIASLSMHGKHKLASGGKF